MARPRTLWLLSIGALLLSAGPCIWDKDTLGDELRGLPGAFDLISGRWFTHTRDYYKKRIDTLPAHLRANPDDLASYDDLAVAYERVRDRDRAIAVMEQKAAALRRAEKIGGANYQQQLYRYHANLGTFFAHSGRFAESLVELERAIEINPDAHFGRERFQIDLIRYVAAARKDRTLWAKHNFMTFSKYQLEKRYWSGRIVMLSFTERIKRDKDRTKHKWTTFDKAYTGVAGMVRFGGIEGSELYRTMGDLFLVRRDLHLAWWSYHRAIERGHPAKESVGKAIASIEKHWKDAKRIVGGVGPLPTAELFAAIRKESRAWRVAFQNAEAKALAAGADTSLPAILEKLVAVADELVPRRKLAAGKSAGRRLRSRGARPPTAGKLEKKARRK